MARPRRARAPLPPLPLSRLTPGFRVRWCGRRFGLGLGQIHAGGRGWGGGGGGLGGAREGSGARPPAPPTVADLPPFYLRRRRHLHPVADHAAAAAGGGGDAGVGEAGAHTTVSGGSRKRRRRGDARAPARPWSTGDARRAAAGRAWWRPGDRLVWRVSERGRGVAVAATPRGRRAPPPPRLPPPRTPATVRHASAAPGWRCAPRARRRKLAAAMPPPPLDARPSAPCRRTTTAP